MAYSAIAVANAFIEKANERGICDLSPMKLQKLVFFCTFLDACFVWKTTD
ncbi:hypothetical protein [Enterobacter sp. A103]|nr:hypothetical protein [Enterobacter sp. A103]MDZ5641674.1 hypothetical protein [Enterobacter sp. A103]